LLGLCNKIEVLNWLEETTEIMSSFASHKCDLIQVLRAYRKLIMMIGAFSLATATDLNASSEEDAKTVAALDTKYQAAVKANDATMMDQILADDFVLVNGRGKVSTKADLIESARKKEVTYERQDEEPGSQKIRVWGDTAVVTALLWIRAVQAGQPIDYKLWFSDTYVRTPTGWRYVFGQASLPLPKAESPSKLPAREKPSE
jgi:ketosteroid isomerase-like protein